MALQAHTSHTISPIHHHQQQHHSKLQPAFRGQRLSSPTTSLQGRRCIQGRVPPTLFSSVVVRSAQFRSTLQRHRGNLLLAYLLLPALASASVELLALGRYLAG